MSDTSKVKPSLLSSIKNKDNKIHSTIKQKTDSLFQPKIHSKNSKRPNLLILLRHSIRYDTNPSKDIIWGKNQYLRPYDPPISDLKLPINTYKNDLSKYIPNINISKIITSPFFRCIQTSKLIGDCIKNKEYIIDSRFGEHKLAINRCINSQTKKLMDDKKMNDEIKNIKCKDYKDASYISKNDGISMLNKGNNNIKVIWQNRETEKPGNEKFVTAFNEIIKTLDKMNGDILVVTHGQVMSEIIEGLTKKIMTVQECGWVAFTKDKSIDTFSKQKTKLIFDPTNAFN